MRSRVVLLWTAALLAAAPAAAPAQNYGDGLAIGGVLLPSGSTQLLGKTRFGEEIGLEVELAFSSSSDDRVSSTSLGLGVGVLSHWNLGNQVQPFVCGRAGIAHSSSDTGEPGGDRDHTSVYIGAGLGAEYFVNRRLSIEGEASLRILFGSLGIETGTRLAALLYL
ncbi:MAG: hypothetical protein FJY74_06405 [Candidatus Eisenbacteria bacterium]|nr:hypothetical protein [Candidatus Eisenbacteria bacterium]